MGQVVEEGLMESRLRARALEIKLLLWRVCTLLRWRAGSRVRELGRRGILGVLFPFVEHFHDEGVGLRNLMAKGGAVFLLSWLIWSAGGLRLRLSVLLDLAHPLV